jgi:DNA-binding MarR family transcriptional regulator
VAAAEPSGTDGLLGHLVRLNVVVDRVLGEVVGCAGMSVADYLVLGVVRRSPGHRNAPTAICALLGRTTGGMSLTLDRLEAAGLVRRLPDPDDRRRIVIEATEAGLELAQRVNLDLHAWEDSLAMSENERASIIEGLGRLTERINAVPTVVG